MECLLLRFDAPLMSFGGVSDESANPTERFPGRSLLTGLLANALGWDHRDIDRLQGLQTCLSHGARWDAEPEHIVDYHTVDFSQAMFQDTGWTTRGRREDRKGGIASNATHQRYRYYWANGVMTVALALQSEERTTLDDLEAALTLPARPVFLGRKTCLPATSLLLGRRKAPSVRAALQAEPLAEIHPRRRPDRIAALWPLEEGAAGETRDIYDLRDWSNNLHRGNLRYAIGFIEVTV